MIRTTGFSVGITVGLCLVLVGLAVPAWSLGPEASTSTVVNLTQGEFEEMARTMGKAYGSPLVVPAAAFRSDGTNPEQLRYAANLGFLQGQDVEGAFAVAPIYIPDGATISAIQASVFDGFDGPGSCDGASNKNVAVWVERVNNTTGEESQMVFFNTTGINPNIQHLLDTSINFPTVEYPEYAYFAVVKVCSSAHTFIALQIFYSMD